MRKNIHTSKSERVQLAHGSGGRLTHELIDKLFKKHFSNPYLDKLDDAASLKPGKHGSRIAFTTDSFVVNPIFFPGGDIGRLSVCGTVNDLAMKGAKPLYLSVGAIIEEGLEITVLERVVRSIRNAALEAGVLIVTGDTKVVERGKADRLFLSTAGIGSIEKTLEISGSSTMPGDAVIINGTIGDHGIAVLSARNDFQLKNEVYSDCAPLNGLVMKMLSGRMRDVHTLRDPTRGGVATTLNEIARASDIGIIIDERALPVRPQVRAACDILGLDPLYVANEGKLLATCAPRSAKSLLGAMKKHKYGRASALIGKAIKAPKGLWLKTRVGGLRRMIMLEGEQLPRIC